MYKFQYGFLPRKAKRIKPGGRVQLKDTYFWILVKTNDNANKKPSDVERLFCDVSGTSLSRVNVSWKRLVLNLNVLVPQALNQNEISFLNDGTNVYDINVKWIRFSVLFLFKFWKSGSILEAAKVSEGKNIS